MVKIVFSQQDDDMSISLQGHAGTAPKGEDLVCAAVTMLTYTAAQAAMDFLAADKLRREPTVSLASGDCVVTICPKETAKAEANAVWRTLLHGYQLLESSYQKAVSVYLIGDSCFVQ